ncbi:C2H2-type zinc finger protein [Aspergillus stella-maris]|uniref:C2H2-type zinc finger protein n=1 Tax=Aspergillus stella-maris TaxID=1810926 RepID=UPI003CCDD21D
MSSCRSSFVSILNNDDNPAFTVRSDYGSSRQYPTSSHPYSLDPHSSRSTSDYHYGRTYSDSPSPRVMRQPFDPVSEATRPASPGSSDCSSYDYAASSRAGSYHPYPSFQDSHAYRPHPEKRLSGNSLAEPPSPQTSIASTSKESVAPKPVRKNKYPCPFAASHACTATFTTSGHAARHGKKHTGEKSVHCPICNKAFTRKDNMKQHIRTHRTHSDEMSQNSTPRSSDAGREWVARRSNPMYDN